MKKDLSRKVIALTLTLMMVFAGVMPLGVFAAEENATTSYEATAVDAATADDADTSGEIDTSGDIASIVDSMTLRQKITQCFMMDFRKWNDESGKTQDMTVLSDDVSEILAEYQFGAVILFSENIKETGDTLDLTKAMQRSAQSKGGLPLLIATDQEGGTVQRLGDGTALPGNMALCATGDTENAATAGRIIGSELRSVGINTTLAPVLDVNINAGNPVIGIRSFSDDADTVGDFGQAYIGGLRENSIIGCAKHYPGHGDTDTDSHTGLPVVDKSLAELEKTEFKPFQMAIDQGIDMIMTAHIIYPQVDDSKILSEKTGKKESRPATMSSKFLNGILRYGMNYDGVVVTDAMNMEGISKYFTEDQAALESLKAGADLICMPVTGVYDKNTFKRRINTVITRIELAVKLGTLDESRLDEAVTRVLTLKKNNGILDYDESDYSKKEAYRTVGSKEHRALEREISAKAITLIRNKDNVLPYGGGRDAKVLMMSPYKNESAQMVIGFNRAVDAGKLSSASKVRVFDFQEYTGGIEGELKEDLDWADLVIISSELYGAADMAYDEGRWRSQIPLAATEYCKSKGKRSVIMSINNPYDVQLYPDADAVMAAYGWYGSSVDVQKAIDDKITEPEDAFGPNIVAGIEVIFGVFDATGKLPVNVPVFDKASKSYIDKIAYERGYGLTYEEPGPGPEPTPTPTPTPSDTAAGTIHSVGNNTYKVLADTSGAAAGKVALKSSKSKKTVTVPATVKIDGKKFSVTQISPSAFKKSKATKLIVKTKKLTKKSVRGSLKKSKIKTVTVKVGKKSVNRKYVKKYKKIFTKKNAGKKVKVR